MCGIYIYPQALEPNPLTEESVKKRGPDFYSTVTRGGYVFNHALLSLTGAFTPQPFDSEKFTLLFNGEIYNFREVGSFESELDCLKTLYEKLYLDFVNEIEGEFVIVVFDWARGEIIIVSDVFGTKPMFVNLHPRGVELASVPSVNQRDNEIYSLAISPNSVTVIDQESKKIKSRFNHHFFDLTQNVSSFDSWLEMFDVAVKKRLPDPIGTSPRRQLFLGLSSGYDSGCIAATLGKIDYPYTAYSVVNEGIISDLLSRGRVVTRSGNHVLLKDFRKKNLTFEAPENFEFSIFSTDGTYKELGSSTKTDSGAKGLAMICEWASNLNQRIYLSGSGADEIYSDYGFQGKKIFSHSNFGGYFKDRLQDYFPWASFFGSTMRAYLMKEELVAGSYGIEGRYPFLDISLTQAWLNLEPSLKNSAYKAPLRKVLETLEFPATFDQKLGF